MQRYDVIVIGGGAAGLLAAGTAAAYGAKVMVLEKKEQPGKKLLITGKGRCNITNAGSLQDFLANIPGQNKFIYGAFNAFSNEDVVNFFARYGVETKIERGNRIFPVSDNAQDIVDALTRYLTESGGKLRCNSSVEEIQVEDQQVVGVKLADGSVIETGRVVIATGGLSAPGTGSTGDGYLFAKKLGHTLTEPRASLVPIETKEIWVKDVQGLGLKNVKAKVVVDNKTIAEQFGEMLFAHFGLTGPIILTLSDWVVPLHQQGKLVKILLDLKPALTEEQLDKRLQRDFSQYINKQFKNSLDDLLPKSLIPVVVELSQIPATKAVNEITRVERKNLVNLIKGIPLTVSKPRSIKEAIITAGGVVLKEINPKTMESKLIKGLYFAGEVVDLHAFTGGYNLQIAFSTGFVAGKAACEAGFNA